MRFIDNIKLEEICPQDGTVVIDKKPGGDVRGMYMICREAIKEGEGYITVCRILNLNTYKIIEGTFSSCMTAYQHIVDNLIKNLPIVICNPEELSLVRKCK